MGNVHVFLVGSLSYYEFYTCQVWGAPENYDMLINTSKISLESAANLILNYIAYRRRETI